MSFFYCFDRADRLTVVLAEVNNTFGGSHRYWLRPEPSSRTFRAAAAKALDVSPFMPRDIDYTFAFTPPSAGPLVVHMEAAREGSTCFDATLVARAAAVDGARDSAGARASSGDDGARDGRHSLAGR